jgi:hypothetical protein
MGSDCYPLDCFCSYFILFKLKLSSSWKASQHRLKPMLVEPCQKCAYLAITFFLESRIALQTLREVTIIYFIADRKPALQLR